MRAATESCLQVDLPQAEPKLGALGIEPVLCTDVLDCAWLELNVLVAQRVDAGRYQKLGMRQLLGERRQGENAGIIGRYELVQVFPYRPVRVTRIDMAAPDPFALAPATVLQQRCGLRIVNEHEVGLFQPRSQRLGVSRVGCLIRPQQSLAQGDAIALQRVVHAFGALEELAVSGNHFPARIDSELPHERHQLGQDFGNAAAAARGIDMHDLRAREGGGELPQLSDHIGSGKLRVIVQHGH